MLNGFNLNTSPPLTSQTPHTEPSNYREEEKFKKRRLPEECDILC